MFFSGIKLNYKNRSIVKTYDSFRKAYIGICSILSEQSNIDVKSMKIMKC